MISVIIPAYNESAVIARTLRSVLSAMKSEPGEIIVVCNGCVDNTFEIASQFGTPVRVLNIEQGSKIAALNLGDENARFFPRMYLDADIELSPNALHEVATTLSGGLIHAAAPAMNCEADGASKWVQRFYRTWLSRPYHRQGHVGSGFVGISEHGRNRFDRFPDIIADDEFIRRQFHPPERSVISSATFTIRVPLDLKSLIKVKTRSRLGTYQLADRFPELDDNLVNATAPPPSPEDAIEQHPQLPPSWRDHLAYGILCLIVRARALWQFRRGEFHHWERDETSRI